MESAFDARKKMAQEGILMPQIVLIAAGKIPRDASAQEE
jgi:hypothetical protein